MSAPLPIIERFGFFVKLKKVYIEITNNCNLSCEFCVTTKRKQGYINEKHFEHVIKNIKSFTDYIYLHVLGEPLLHPKLGALLDIAERYEMKTSITTNATLLKQKQFEILGKESLRQMNYSLHSFSDSEILENIFEFIKNSPQIYHCLRLWNVEDGIENDNVSVTEKISKHFGINLTNEITKGNGTKIADNVFLQIDRRFTWPDLSLPEICTSGRCYGLKNNIGILLDGTVVPCCLDAEGAIALGNIYDNSLEKILSCERAEKIRTGFRKSIPVEPLCRTCGFLSKRFGRD